MHASCLPQKVYLKHSDIKTIREEMKIQQCRKIAVVLCILNAAAVAKPIKNKFAVYVA